MVHLPHILPNICYLIFSKTAILTGVRWDLTVVLTCISLSILSCIAGHVGVSVGKKFYSVPLPIFYHILLLFSRMSSLHIWAINALSNIWFSHIFVHSTSFPFILLIAYFDVQKLCSLILRWLFCCVFSVISKKILCTAGGNGNVLSHFRKQYGSSAKIVN